MAMLSQDDGNDLIFNLEGSFQDLPRGANNRTRISFVPGETAQSHILRVKDLISAEGQNAPSVHETTKEIILSLLQCAARCYGEGGLAKEAAELIQCDNFGAILRLGIDDKILHALKLLNLRYMEPEAAIRNRSMNSNVLAII